ncbi:hypothetical protein [Pacificimonas flava]|uniref:17 kDa surface antigen n=1 Tax=Pacificimonas flava TaxID=1234595 RepID=M2U7V9_9SPHN|nr:hypothetical protein [Pacificimonas flava]EMD84072.1 hypothetical protein C725_0002 [Pacificimonas flava]MBB5280050.1 hypothetical protein [Pacificimonas flava]
MRTLILAAAAASLALPIAAPAAADPPPWAKAHGKRAKDHDRDRDWDAARHYRKGDYRARRLDANDRVWRGSDGRYYCKRDDGTAGLIIGGLAGGTLGNVLAPDGSKLLGSILGGAAGAYIGKSEDDDGVTCR